MLGVLVNTNYTPRPSSQTPILERLAKALYSQTARQPDSHTATDVVSALIDYKLSYSKLGMQGFFTWHFP
jgi:hypothetical protein